LLREDVDIWLLTEVNRKWANVAGTKVLHFNSHLSKEVMGPKSTLGGRPKHFATGRSRRPACSKCGGSR